MYFLGDIHGDVSQLRKAADRVSGPLIQVGDFGFSAKTLEWLKTQRFEYPVIIMDGNHEVHELLPEGPGLFELAPNCWYVGRGTVVELEGKRVGFMGGGCSIDKDTRLKFGWHWSELEIVTDEQVDRLIANGPVDLLVTHQPPESLIQRHFDPAPKLHFFGVPLDWVGAGSSLRLDRLWSTLGNPMLVCGHMHRKVEGNGYRMLEINELIEL